MNPPGRMTLVESQRKQNGLKKTGKADASYCVPIIVYIIVYQPYLLQFSSVRKLFYNVKSNLIQKF